jgi:hypothetical protein
MIESLLAGEEEMKADTDADREEKKKGWMSIPNPREKTLNLAKRK